MAYTYDDFLKAANNAGVMDRFSTSDLSTAQKNPEYGLSMVGLLGDISKATTEEQRLLATEAANQLRKNYGIYSTGDKSQDYSYAGSYGSQINDLMGQINNYGSFDYAGKNAYQEALEKVTGYGSFDYENQDAYKQLLANIANPGSFSYDPQSDASFQAYRKAYLREGDRASENALAKASAVSGGVPSSYAVNAAQQAGNYYAGQLADVIPTLEQNAYQRYLNDYSSKLSGLSALQSDRAFDYQKYLDTYNQLQNNLGALENDRAFNYENWMNQYNMLQNNLGNLQTQDATDYQRYLDAYAQKYQAEQDEYDKAMTLYNILGYATPEIAKILGLPMPEETVEGTTSGSGVGSDAGTGGLTQEQLDAAGSKVAESMIAGAINGASGISGTLLDIAKGSDMAVTNRYTDTWVAIGSGRVTWPELAQMVQSGEVVEIVDEQNGTVTYAYATGSKQQTHLPTPQKGTGLVNKQNDVGGNIHLRNDAIK